MCVLRVLYCSCADGPVQSNEGGECADERVAAGHPAPNREQPSPAPNPNALTSRFLSYRAISRAGPCRFRLRHHITFPPICVSFCLLRFSPSAATGKKRCNGLKNGKRKKFFVAEDCHPQTIALVETRGSAIGLDIVVSVHGMAASPTACVPTWHVVVGCGNCLHKVALPYKNYLHTQRCKVFLKTCDAKYVIEPSVSFVLAVLKLFFLFM